MDVAFQRRCQVSIKLVIIFKKMRKVGMMQVITNVLISHYKYIYIFIVINFTYK